MGGLSYVALAAEEGEFVGFDVSGQGPGVENEDLEAFVDPSEEHEGFLQLEVRPPQEVGHEGNHQDGNAGQERRD